jgi:hypothetical protein
MGIKLKSPVRMKRLNMIQTSKTPKANSCFYFLSRIPRSSFLPEVGTLPGIESSFLEVLRHHSTMLGDFIIVN